MQLPPETSENEGVVDLESNLKTPHKLSENNSKINSDSPMSPHNNITTSNNSRAKFDINS